MGLKVSPSSLVAHRRFLEFGALGFGVLHMRYRTPKCWVTVLPCTHSRDSNVNGFAGLVIRSRSECGCYTGLRLSCVSVPYFTARSHVSFEMDVQRGT